MPNDEIINGTSQRIESNAARQLSDVMCRYDFDSATAAIV